MDHADLEDALDVPRYLSRLEDHFVQLLDKLERIALVMERFDNVMNPTLDLAEEAFRAQMEARPAQALFTPPQHHSS
jgi:hypothetical protein